MCDLGFEMLGEVTSKNTAPGATGRPYKVVSALQYLENIGNYETAEELVDIWSTLTKIKPEHIMRDVVVFVRLNRPRQAVKGGPAVSELAFPSCDLIHSDEFWAEAEDLCGS